MHPTYPQFGTSWDKAINFDILRDYRLNRLRSVMKEEKIDVLITFKQDNIRYMTSYRPLMWETGYVTRNASILIRGERPILYAHAGDSARARKAMTWLDPEKEIIGLGSMEDPGISKTVVSKWFKEVLTTYRVSDGVIGTDGSTLFTLNNLITEFPKAKFTDADRVFRKAKEIKSKEEIALLEIASAIVDVGVNRALDLVSNEGVTDAQVAGVAAEAIYSCGAEYLPTNPIVASGQYSAPFFPFSKAGKLMTYGDTVIIDLSCIHDGYCSREARTAIVGKPSSTQRMYCKRAYDTLNSAIDSMKPGANLGKIASAGEPNLKKSGGQFSYLNISGIGVSLNEAPSLSNLEHRNLSDGMVVIVESGIHDSAHGGVRLADVIHVTASGPVRLTRISYEEKFLF